MTEKPIRIPLGTRVMPGIILNDIKGVSPMVGPSDSVMETPRMITERQGEGQFDLDVDPETGLRPLPVDVGSVPRGTA